MVVTKKGRRGIQPKSPKTLPIAPLTSNDICSHCCTPFALLNSQSIIHPLWPKEPICKTCADKIARCHICERKAVPWTFPKPGEPGKVQQYDVLIQTPEGDGILSTRAQLMTEYSRPRNVCGRCRAVGLICTKDQATREIRFILESLYLHFGILFGEGMLDLQRTSIDGTYHKFKGVGHYVPLPEDFSSQEEFENWLTAKCKEAAYLLPIQLFWGKDGQVERSVCHTAYFEQEDLVHKSFFGLPYVECIDIESHLSRPKFWAIVVHELIHAYLHLYRGLDPKATGQPDSLARIALEDGIAHAITQMSLERITAEILDCPDLIFPSRSDFSIGPPPTQLWQIGSKEFQEDLPYAKPATPEKLVNWMNNPCSPFYSLMYEELQQLYFVMSKIQTDTPYEQQFKRARSLIASRMARSGMESARVASILKEFVRTDYLPKS